MIRSHIKGIDGLLVGTIDNIAGGYRILWREPTKEYPGRVHYAERRIYRSRDELRRAIFNACPGAVIVDMK